MPYTINPNDIDIVMNALERHLDNCYTYKYQDEDFMSEECLAEDKDYLHNEKTIKTLKKVIEYIWK